MTKIETALKAVPGVTSAQMNFAQRTVTVTGSAERQALIEAVDSAGYNAKTIDADAHAEALEERKG